MSEGITVNIDSATLMGVEAGKNGMTKDNRPWQMYKAQFTAKGSAKVLKMTAFKKMNPNAKGMCITECKLGSDYCLAFKEVDKEFVPPGENNAVPYKQRTIFFIGEPKNTQQQLPAQPQNQAAGPNPTPQAEQVHTVQSVIDALKAKVADGSLNVQAITRKALIDTFNAKGVQYQEADVTEGMKQITQPQQAQGGLL